MSERLKVKVRNAPGYEDFEGELITTLRNCDGDLLCAVAFEWEGKEDFAILPDASVSPLYDVCGCISPCPDHKSPAQDGRRDRAYWDDRYASNDTE